MKFSTKMLLPVLTCGLLLSACGGSGSETVDNAVNDAVDKITPEGGKGGLYVGYFVEDNDGDNGDIDVGATYFDIGKDYASSVYSQMSYQQKACQNPNNLATENVSTKTGSIISGIYAGHLDPAAIFDKDILNHLKFDQLKTNVTAMPFNGKYNDGADSWQGQYSYEVGANFGKKLSSNIDGCAVQYTLGFQGDFHAYPVSYQLGNLNAALNGIGSTATLTWQAPANTAVLLVSQIDTTKATSRGDGFVANRVYRPTDIPSFTPIATATATNYVFVVQAFDAQNKLIGFQTVTKTL